MNHLGDTNEMVSDTPRTDDHNWHDGDYDDPLHAFYDFACQLERELNAANVEIEEKRKDVVYLATEKAKLEERIKRLEAELERTKQDRNAIAKNTREPLLLQLDHANERINRLEEAGDVMASILNNTRKDWYTSDQCEVSAFNWNEAKEAKL